jgi:hypothetical protein
MVRVLPRLAVPAVLAAVLACALLAPTAGAGRASVSGTCSLFGPSWAHSYNAKAILTGNPIRILSACCRPTERIGISHCFIMVTLAGTRDRGCESVDIGRNGLVAGPGRHETCKNVA